MAKTTTGKSFLFGALAGAVVGSVTALLFAPKAGKELRQDIADGAHKVSDTTVRLAQQVGEKTGQLAKTVGGGATEAADRAKQAASSFVANVKSWRGAGDRVESELEGAIVTSLTAGIAPSEAEITASALEELEPETEQFEYSGTKPEKSFQTIG